MNNKDTQLIWENYINDASTPVEEEGSDNPFDENIVNPKSLERVRSSLNVAETPEDKAEIEKILQYLQNKVKEPSRIEQIINAIRIKFHER